MAKFELVSNFAPTGDQPHAIDTLVDGIENGLREQVLKGVTGSGKTFTIANVIKNTVKTLIFYYYRKKSTCSNCRESNNIRICYRFSQYLDL